MYYGFAAIGVILWNDWPIIDQSIFQIKHPKMENILSYISTFIYGTTICSSYLFQVFRLKLSFQHSLYKISKNVVYLQTGIGIILFPLSSFSALLKHSLNAEYFIITLFFNIFYVFGLLHITFSFNYRLFQLVLLQRQSISCYMDKNQLIEDNALSERQLRLIQTITKHTLLCSIFILNALLFVIPLTMYSQYSKLDVVTIVYVIHDGIVVINALVIIFLSFSINYIYYNYLCFKCDRKLRRFYEHLAEKEIKEQRLSTLSKNSYVRLQ